MWSSPQKQNHLQKSALFRHSTVFIDVHCTTPTAVSGTRWSLYTVFMNNCVFFLTHVISSLKSPPGRPQARQMENRARQIQPKLCFSSQFPARTAEQRRKAILCLLERGMAGGSQSGHSYTPSHSQLLTPGNRGEMASGSQRKKSVQQLRRWGVLPRKSLREAAWGESKGRWINGQSVRQPHNSSRCPALHPATTLSHWSRYHACTDRQIYSLCFPNFPLLLDVRNIMEIKDGGSGCKTMGTARHPCSS